MAAKNILSQLNIVEVAALTDSGTAFIGFGAKADGLYMKNGAAAELRLLTAGDVGVNIASYGHTHSGYQTSLSGTGFVKISGTTISYDPTTYLSTKANVEAVLTGSISSHYHDLSGYATTGHTHTGVYQPLDADLTAIAALAGTSGLLKKTAADTWTLDTTSYVSGTPWTAMGYVTGTPWTGMGYLTSQISHADVVVDGDFTCQGIMLRGATSGVYSILTDNSTNWNAAFGWGNHSGLYSLLAHTHFGYQATLSGTGFVKSTAGVISYDTNTYVTGTPWTAMGYISNLATGNSNTLALTNPGIPTFTPVTAAVASSGTALTTGGQVYSFVTGFGYLTAITKAQVEAVLTGMISSHSHALSSHNIQSHSDVYIPVTLDGTYSGKALYWTGSNWGIGTPWTSLGYLTSITKAQVEAVLTGAISSHTHSYEPTLGNPVTSGYVLASTTAGARSWVAQGGSYTLPLAANGTRGGVQLGFANYYGTIGITLSGEQLVCILTKPTIEYALTGNITTHTHSYAPINGSSSNAFATAALTVTGAITATTTITATGNITGAEVYRGSSRALKKNIADFDFDAIGFLNDVSIKRYYLKSNNLFGIGFIAEDTHPWLSGDDQKSHVFGNHLGLLTKAIQEEDQKVEDLKLEVLELRARLRELEIARANGWR
jgi:hypothetical protein